VRQVRTAVKVVVVNNSTLGMIKWEQMAFLGNPEYGCDLHPIDFAAFARACGATGYRVENASDCGRTLDEALSVPGPVLVDAIVDPHEPPLPPKVTFDQARHFVQALVRGEPHREEIALTAVSGMMRQLI
jgi:pyruvate dehydrogenase (quinone)